MTNFYNVKQHRKQFKHLKLVSKLIFFINFCTNHTLDQLVESLITFIWFLPASKYSDFDRNLLLISKKHRFWVLISPFRLQLYQLVGIVDFLSEILFCQQISYPIILLLLVVRRSHQTTLVDYQSISKRKFCLK